MTRQNCTQSGTACSEVVKQMNN